MAGQMLKAIYCNVLHVNRILMEHYHLHLSLKHVSFKIYYGNLNNAVAMTIRCVSDLNIASTNLLTFFVLQTEIAANGLKACCCLHITNIVTG